mmetsp:Transcript_6292/g.15089  ORF Transcript_6292/g.15089 Transcript_6292/m.15089 type:complete len:236 (+) Transcript_6292:289-996(+)
MGAVDLYGIINDLRYSSWCCDLDHRYMSPSCLETFLVRYHCSQVAQLPVLGDFQPRLSNGHLHRIFFGKHPPKGLPSVGSIDNGGQGLFCHAQRPHAMMDSTWSQSALGDFKATTFSKENVGLWNSYVVKDDFGMVMLLSENCQWSQDGHTWCITRHKYHGLLLVQRACETGPAQQHEKFALWSNCAADPPLVAIDDVVIPICLNPRGNVRGITRSNARLGHGIGRTYVTSQQWL